jgi:N-acetylglucosamine-6-sulfatase
LLLQCPQLFKPGTKVDPMVANIDIAPTLLEAAALQVPDGLDGRSFLPLAKGEVIPWRDSLLYEYFWERNLPMVPTMHALRTENYAYIHYYGIWDTDELYDLRQDPHQMRNLIQSAEGKELVQQLNRRLFETLATTDGMCLPLAPDRGMQQNERRRSGPRAADFPAAMYRE